ncbi:VOC family protein [Ancylobacter sp. MQZ15Z-1]|uniref:VOC family protein n=1 Tax=Ancylobacter mangrovi TaxID=2972472 RepID=A0A9X2PFQ5_9HYPH|nr:VOC family protein [Ancylobacter mangrovi]MCS0497095.1 VOC family protein [Ancylobacter mangrovi]
MIRGLDHVVHVVRDLEAAGASYGALGFTVGARNRHPWGTHNRLVQLPGFFIEMLEIAEPAAIPPHGEGRFSFGAFNRDFLAEVGQGPSMLVLEGRDPLAEKEVFDLAGFGGFEIFDFARRGTRPDGSEVEVAFSLTFARDPAAPRAGFFTCLQRYPENFWAPALQRHANGASGIAGVVLTAAEPAAHAAFLSAFLGTDPRRAVDGWYVAHTPRGDVEVMSPELYAERFGVAAPVDATLRLAALRFAVADAGAVRASASAMEPMEGVTVVGPEDAFGAALVFETVS